MQAWRTFIGSSANDHYFIGFVASDHKIPTRKAPAEDAVLLSSTWSSSEMWIPSGDGNLGTGPIAYQASLPDSQEHNKGKK